MDKVEAAKAAASREAQKARDEKKRVEEEKLECTILQLGATVIAAMTGEKLIEQINKLVGWPLRTPLFLIEQQSIRFLLGLGIQFHELSMEHLRGHVLPKSDYISGTRTQPELPSPIHSRDQIGGKRLARSQKSTPKPPHPKAPPILPPLISYDHLMSNPGGKTGRQKPANQVSTRLQANIRSTYDTNSGTPRQPHQKAACGNKPSTIRGQTGTPPTEEHDPWKEAMDHATRTWSEDHLEAQSPNEALNITSIPSFRPPSPDEVVHHKTTKVMTISTPLHPHIEGQQSEVEEMEEEEPQKDEPENDENWNGLEEASWYIAEITNLMASIANKELWQDFLPMKRNRGTPSGG
ncbi:uncharacterized protein EI90DRAFT_3291683 [Cantharellus anzutake]|uniref:uncharacterized protein n=1 Tax=Cantharellus anzutake TaxID=1750568 RepID=UPI00190853F1|nr:uncharacterized protein EI90DRAFT_3291683 [Cantharellus anzutake]KAF8325642.1 hypothetical protein EI90DRAFT_3291683 [Cantharellus anzutake]